ncbi:MAG: hypothetical protein R3E01_23565 [Pirellulaceae bacterium]
MKILHWRRAVAATLMAVGVGFASPALAAELNTNLVVNPSFESVDVGDPGPFTSLRISSGWIDPTTVDGVGDDDFVYPYSSAYSGTPAPPGAGDYHYSGAFGTTAGEISVTQSIGVSTGPSAAEIAGGRARFDLSAYFSGYREQVDSSSVRARFLDASDVQLGQATVGSAAFFQSLPITDGQRDWGQDTLAGLIPIGTTTVHVDVIANVSTGNHDGYLDLVDFRIGTTTVDFGLNLSVDTNSGRATLRNLTGQAVEINYYEIVSSNGSLTPTTWNSLQDQDFEGSGGTSGLGDGWEEAGGASSNVLSESFLTGTSNLATGSEIAIGTIFTRGGTQDLVVRYGTPDGKLLYGNVSYEALALLGDYNQNGTVDAADYTVWKDNFGSTSALAADGNANGVVDAADYTIWKDNFGSTAVSVGASSVPEPNGVLLAGLGTLAMGLIRRISTRRS